MSETDTAVVTTQPQPPARTPVAVGTRGLEIRDLDSLWRFSNYVAKSGLAPKGMESPEAIFVAVEMGMELGIPAMMALQNIGVINGRPGVFGDLPLALVRNSGLLEEYKEEEIGKPSEDSWGFRVICKRVGCPFKHETFTVADAKRAQLWGKAGPWTQYPKRMLKFRARGYLLRDEFGDVLKGVKTIEELRDESEEDKFKRAKQVHAPLGESPQDESPAQAPLVDVTPSQPSNLPPKAGRRGPTLVEEPLTDEDKSELAKAGLAPAEPEQRGAAAAPEPHKLGGAGSTPAPAYPDSDQTKLAEIVITEASATFDDFVKWGRAELGHGIAQTGPLPWEAISSFDDVPNRAAAFCLKARRGLVTALRKMKGE